MASIPSSSTIESNNTPGRNYTPALIALAILYFMMGFITCLNDTLVPFFKKGFTLSYSESSLVQFYFFLTYAIMSIPAAKIVTKVGYQKGMVLGFLVAAGGALLFFPASIYHEYTLFLMALFVLAIGIVLLQVAANPYITALGPAKTASSRFTLIQGVGSLGTTVAPLFGAYYILGPLQESDASSDAVKGPYLGIALVLVLIAVLVYVLALPVIKTSDNSAQTKENKKSIFRFRNLKFGVIALFAYVGAEVAIGTFLTNYISEVLTITESEANNYVAVYWGSMMVGRIIGYFGLKVVHPARVLTLTSVLSITLILLSINTDGMLAVWSMIAVGLCNSVMFAIIFSLSVEGLGNYTTQASGLLSTAIVGGAIVSYLQGVLIDNSTWQIAFLLPVACYAYIIYYGISGYKSNTAAA